MHFLYSKCPLEEKSNGLVARVGVFVELLCLARQVEQNTSRILHTREALF